MCVASQLWGNDYQDPSRSALVDTSHALLSERQVLFKILRSVTVAIKKHPSQCSKRRGCEFENPSGTFQSIDTLDLCLEAQHRLVYIWSVRSVHKHYRRIKV